MNPKQLPVDSSAIQQQIQDNRQQRSAPPAPRPNPWRWILWILPILVYSTPLYFVCYRAGYHQAKREIPSSLYIHRPRQNDIKPFGYDGKEGIDWYADEIHKGGLYISLQDFKMDQMSMPIIGPKVTEY